MPIDVPTHIDHIGAPDPIDAPTPALGRKTYGLGDWFRNPRPPGPAAENSWVSVGQAWGGPWEDASILKRGQTSASRDVALVHPCSRSPFEQRVDLERDRRTSARDVSQTK